MPLCQTRIWPLKSKSSGQTAFKKKRPGSKKYDGKSGEQEIDREQHTLYGMMGALMMEKGDGCPEIEVYRQQVFQLTAELLEINERLAALAEETDQS